MEELDRYIESLRSMPNEVGEAVRAMDHAERKPGLGDAMNDTTKATTAGLPPLEVYLAGSLARDRAAGDSEETWMRHHVNLAMQPPLEGAPNADTASRLDQAVANLREAGLWPW